MHSRTSKGLVAIGALVAVASLLACGPKAAEAPSTADTARSDAAARMAPPPKLGKSWKEMEPADWTKHVDDNAIDFPKELADSSKSRECTTGESERCNLRITPVSNSDGISERGLHPNGEILARIENIGTEDEKTLGIPAGAVAYWVAFVDPTGTPRSVLVDLTKKGAVFGAEMTFGACTNADHAKPDKRATFTTCKNIHDPSRVDKLDLHTSPPWIGCVEGCCVATGT